MVSLPKWIHTGPNVKVASEIREKDIKFWLILDVFMSSRE